MSCGQQRGVSGCSESPVTGEREPAGCTEMGLASQPCSMSDAELSCSGSPGHSSDLILQGAPQQSKQQFPAVGVCYAAPTARGTHHSGSRRDPVFTGEDHPWRQTQNCIPLSYSTFTVFLCLFYHHPSWHLPPLLLAGASRRPLCLQITQPHAPRH